jgi:hypothetical protein
MPSVRVVMVGRAVVVIILVAAVKAGGLVLVVAGIECLCISIINAFISISSQIYPFEGRDMKEGEKGHGGRKGQEGRKE